MFKLISLKCLGFKRLDLPEEIMFPDGRLLVQGRNESGKSTIMEAIHYALYGMPLRPTKRASNDDVINYAYDTATVELRFTIDDATYHVRRVLKKKSANQHELHQVQPDGSLETITRGARAVDRHILDLLHGVDSDALLNSCLVEQKELGKLEASSKAERVKAMSSLLNLEAFLEAREEIKNDRRSLEKTHGETSLKLQEAEQASKNYDLAEQKKSNAEKRLNEITLELAEVKQESERLSGLIQVLEEMKRQKGVLDESNARLEGQLETKQQLENQLKQITEAEEAITGIEAQLPEEQARLDEAKAKLEALERLLELESQRTQQKSQAEKTGIRLEEAKKQLREAEQALNRVKSLDEQIKEYTPARKAESSIKPLSQAINTLKEAEEKRSQADDEKNETEQKLRGLEYSDSDLHMLASKEKSWNKERENIQQKKTLGTALAAVGALLLLGFFVSMYLPVIGVVLLLSGVILLRSNNPQRVDEALQKLREERDRLLGDAQRISEFKETISEAENRLEHTQAEIDQAMEALNMQQSSLPQSPNDYSAIIKPANLTDSLEALREAVNRDLQTLTKYEAERRSHAATADTLDERRNQHTVLQKQLEEQSTQHATLEESVKLVTKETGVETEQEPETRAAYGEQSNRVTQLNTQLENAQKTASGKPGLLTELTGIQESLQTLRQAVEEAEKRITELEQENNVTLSVEKAIRTQYESALKTSSSLGREQTERSDDVQESDKVMQQTGELKEQHPKLLEENDREEFRLEAMRRATVLLDTTRDSIMSGVKQNVEKNMMQFLPGLTDHRYNMARIDEKAYRIEVYDREAKRWRSKGVFSGATQDQFSLALRLSFAISTIPGTRGAQPGFIFLDEPLSGFDAQRRSGFIQLLREELSRHFPQIIVISHLEALQQDFQHRIVLEQGKVIEEVQR